MAADGLRLGSGSSLPPSFHLVLCQSTSYPADQREKWTLRHLEFSWWSKWFFHLNQYLENLVYVEDFLAWQWASLGRLQSFTYYPLLCFQSYQISYYFLSTLYVTVQKNCIKTFPPVLCVSWIVYPSHHPSKQTDQCLSFWLTGGEGAWEGCDLQTGSPTAWKTQRTRLSPITPNFFAH